MPCHPSSHPVTYSATLDGPASNEHNKQQVGAGVLHLTDFEWVGPSVCDCVPMVR